MRRAVAIAVIMLAASWTIATPAVAVPIGTTVAVGDSMGHDEPHLLVYADLEPTVGDVVVFESHGQWIVHRAIERTDDGLLTKGDANPVPDQRHSTAFHEWPTESNTAGIVILRVPLLESLLVLLGTTALVYRRSLQAAAVALLRLPNSHP